MAVVNELLIQKVFQEMLKYKPSMQKMLIADEEEEETFDTRLLGDMIIRNFPWPIGVELRRLFSASTRQLDRMRLDQIFTTIDKYLNLSPLVIDTNPQANSRPKGVNKQHSYLYKYFQMRSPFKFLDSYTKVAREIFFGQTGR